MPCDSELAVATKVAAGAPEAEIEITPEMIEAGALIIERDFGHDSTLYRGLALAVSEAVLRAGELARLSCNH
jgi:hypothetical protein